MPLHELTDNLPDEMTGIKHVENFFYNGTSFLLLKASALGFVLLRCGFVVSSLPRNTSFNVSPPRRMPVFQAPQRVIWNAEQQDTS